MRKVLVVGTVIVSLFGFAPSHARMKQVSKKKLTFSATAACAFACAHNVEGYGNFPFELAGEGNPAASSLPSKCGAPSPAGSYDDVVVTVPKKVNTLVFSIFPRGDWDSYICTKPARGRSRVVAEGANSWPSDYPPPSSDLSGPLGIRETITIPVKPGQRYILRAYNWADTANCPGEVRFLTMS